jgi:hypothetical protein
MSGLASEGTSNGRSGLTIEGIFSTGSSAGFAGIIFLAAGIPAGSFSFSGYSLGSFLGSSLGYS